MLTDPQFWQLVALFLVLVVVAFMLGYWCGERDGDERVREVFRRIGSDFRG